MSKAKKKFKRSYLKIMFSTYVGNSQNTADIATPYLPPRPQISLSPISMIFSFEKWSKWIWWVAIPDIHEVDAERRTLTFQTIFVLITSLLRKPIAVNQKVYSQTKIRLYVFTTHGFRFPSESHTPHVSFVSLQLRRRGGVEERVSEGYSLNLSK